MHNMYEDHDGSVYEKHKTQLKNLTLDELKVLNDFHYIRLDVITQLIEEKHQELGAIGELADEDYIYLQAPLRYSRSPVRARSRSTRSSSRSPIYPSGYSARTCSESSYSSSQERSRSESPNSYPSSPVRLRLRSPARARSVSRKRSVSHSRGSMSPVRNRNLLGM